MSVRIQPSAMFNVVNDKGTVLVEQRDREKWNVPYAASSYLHGIDRIVEMRDAMQLVIDRYVEDTTGFTAAEVEPVEA